MAKKPSTKRRFKTVFIRLRPNLTFKVRQAGYWDGRWLPAGLSIDINIAGVRRGAKTDDVASVMFSLTKGETNKLFKRISKLMEK